MQESRHAVEELITANKNLPCSPDVQKAIRSGLAGGCFALLQRQSSYACVSMRIACRAKYTTITNEAERMRVIDEATEGIETLWMSAINAAKAYIFTEVNAKLAFKDGTDPAALNILLSKRYEAALAEAPQNLNWSAQSN